LNCITFEISEHAFFFIVCTFEKRDMEVKGEQLVRYKELKSGLEAEGLQLRDDSQLCWDYVRLGSGAKWNDPKQIVQKMCEAEYLHKYCNFQFGYGKAQRQMWKNATYGGKVLNEQSRHNAIRRAVLSTTRTQRFPPMWPWQQGMTPSEWMELNDLSHRL
jgi:hypothetical protein